MFARVSTFRQSTGGPAPTNARGGSEFMPQLRPIAGFRGLISLIDPAGGRSLAITLWETEEALAASELVANRIRADGAAANGEEIVAVERYAVDTIELEH